jgi:hypothetical protein
MHQQVQNGKLRPSGGNMANQPFEIHIRGQLSQKWADWLEGMQMRCLEDGEMILSGTLADQAALMGVLNKLNHLNLTILSVKETDPADAGQKVDDQPAVNDNKC